MYDNLLHQAVANQLKDEIKKNVLPRALLFSGPISSGKLTCALETARILSCVGKNRGYWECTCPACMQQKSLVSNNLILAGSRDCITEISATQNTFLQALYNNASYLTSTRYLFLRAVRKLTMRFSQILWQDDNNLTKIASLVSEIDEEMETLDFPHELPDVKIVEKTMENIVSLAEKLESDFLYDSIPISQVRNLSSWARMKSIEGKKTIIIENADKMLEGVRNALLKILEEPPEDTVFILTTARKNAIMPTILSRVRPYNFSERTLDEQQDVLERIFHKNDLNISINDYLLGFLPVPLNTLKNEASEFYDLVAENKIPDIQKTIKSCKNFNPRMMLKIFLTELLNLQKNKMKTAKNVADLTKTVKAVQKCYSDITIYNQGVQAGFENLVKNIS